MGNEQPKGPRAGPVEVGLRGPAPTRAARFLALLWPLAAATVATLAWLLLWKGGAIGVTSADADLRPFPLPNRFDVTVALPLAAAAALAVSLLRRGRWGRWLRRGLGVGALGLLGWLLYWGIRSWRNDCFDIAGCSITFAFVDGALLLGAAVALLLGGRCEPGPRGRWAGLALALAVAGGSAAWTLAATRTLERYQGAALAGIGLTGYFEANQGFEPATLPRSAHPSAVPMLPMQGATMRCGGDWRVVTFPDRRRCLPVRPLLRLEAADVASVEVARPTVGGPPGILLTLQGDGVRRMRAALRATRSFRLVLLNRRRELVVDARVDQVAPGPTFLISLGDQGPDHSRILAALLGRH